MLKGGQLLKVKSNSWRRERFYKLQEDCKTIWQESRKVMRTPESQLCECPGLRGRGRELLLRSDGKHGLGWGWGGAGGQSWTTTKGRETEAWTGGQRSVMQVGYQVWGI